MKRTKSQHKVFGLILILVLKSHPTLPNLALSPLLDGCSAKIKNQKLLTLNLTKFLAEISHRKNSFPPFPLHSRGLHLKHEVQLSQKSKYDAPFFEISFCFENISLSNI